MTWTLYGLVISNLGKQDNILRLDGGQTETVPEYLYDNYGYSSAMLGYIVLILATFIVAFWTAGWAGFRYLSFDVRFFLLVLEMPCLQEHACSNRSQHQPAADNHAVITRVGI